MSTAVPDGFDWPSIRAMVEAPAYFRRVGLDADEVRERRQRISARLAGIEWTHTAQSKP